MENKEHTLRTAEVKLDEIIAVDGYHFPATTYEDDFAGGSARYVREDIAVKAMQEFASQVAQLRTEDKDSHISRLEESVRVITDKWSRVCQENERLKQALQKVWDHKGTRLTTEVWEIVETALKERKPDQDAIDYFYSTNLTD